MTITLPDSPATGALSEAEMRLEVACALFVQGRIDKVGARDMAGLDFFAFQRALRNRQISTFTVDDLHHDVAALDAMPGAKISVSSR
jgi:predicted HTH domain antitoxin